MALTDHTGMLARFILTPGNAAEIRAMEPLLDGIEPGEVLADKAYDSRALRESLAERGIEATIPSTRSRKRPYPYDEESYKRRHLVENLFADLKQFRGVATRYMKLVEHYESLVCLAGWVLATRAG